MYEYVKRQYFGHFIANYTVTTYFYLMHNAFVVTRIASNNNDENEKCKK